MKYTFFSSKHDLNTKTSCYQTFNLAQNKALTLPLLEMTTNVSTKPTEPKTTAQSHDTNLLTYSLYSLP
jgi:hypothetical protein